MPRWLLWSFLAVLCWGLWAVIPKLIGAALTAGQSQTLSTLGLVPVMVALAASRRLTVSGIRRRGIGAAFCAGALAGAANTAYYHALQLGGKAATLVSLTAMYPLVTVLLAMLFLRERLNPIQFAGLLLSLIAIWLFNVASVEGILSGWIAWAIIPIVLWGVAGLLQKVSTNHVSGELSTLWFLAAFVPMGILMWLLQPLAGPLALRTWLLVVALGLFFGLGNLAVLLAFAHSGKASVITPLTGLYSIVSVPAAILFFGEKVSVREWAGIGLALAAVVALAHETPPQSANASTVLPL